MPLTLSAANRQTALPNGPLSRGVSPAANRTSGHYSVPYDPRDWSSGIQQVDPQGRLDEGEDGLAEPPPPYVLPVHGFNTTVEADASVQTQQPCSTAVSHTSHNTRPARQAPFGVTTTQQTAHRLRQEVINLPAPPRRGPASRGIAIDVEASYMQPSYTRRSTSAGPSLVTTQERPVGTDLSSSLRFQQGSRSSMLLPGPPSGPPPSSSRSQSTGGQSTTRPRPTRLQIRDSNLATIPATPADINTTTFPRTDPTLSLRIDTTTSNQTSDPPVLVDTIAAPTTSTSLARRSAVRGSSLNRTLRDDVRAGGVQPAQELPSTSVSNNPWADVTERTLSSLDARTVHIVPPLRNEGIRNPSNVGTRQMGTPPVTPGINLSKGRADPLLTPQQPRDPSTPPLSQKPLNSANSFSAQSFASGHEDDVLFVEKAIQRHTEFIRREVATIDDATRLQTFLDYMQIESAIRRERYIAAYQSDTFNAETARGMLFSGARSRQASTHHDNIPSASAIQSPATFSNSSSAHGETFSNKIYQPALSTIASAEPDEMSSRGRAPSRWWESQTASNYQDEQGRAVTRSKRESKYMSLSKQLLQNMELEVDPLLEDGSLIDAEYPAEKHDPGSFGIYEDETSTTTTPPPISRSQQINRRTSLDISRFITLPPPYPRHHPAVNNCHPDLAEYRSTVRTLSDLSDARKRYERHDASILALRAEREKGRAAAHKRFRADVRNQVEDGTMTYQEAAREEEKFKQDNFDAEKRALQTEFETLKDVVVNPLHEQFNQRINDLNHSIHSLQKELSTGAVDQNPDRPVQEGDDVPELLEQLTQLKWLFEAREHLHHELFQLLSRRNDVYKAVVVLPYKQASHLDKVRDTEAWFEGDAAARHATFCAESLNRHEAFFKSVEESASRGIALQSSAFWDITPGLVALVQKIPLDLSELDIHIPDDELAENPSYRQYPQQYLYLLLRHAQQSSYQYIEGQINLHCLAHGVKTATLAVQYKAAQAREKAAGQRGSYTEDAHRQDESELNNELKDRAKTIEEQWHDSLGQYLINMQERVRAYLEVNGGWDDFDVSEV